VNRPGSARARAQSPCHAEPGIGRADRAPGLPDDRPGQLCRLCGYADVCG